MCRTRNDYITPEPAEIQKPRKTRIACYERVSTEEQAVNGHSLAAQKQALNDYCKAHDYLIIDHYTDEGISGGKPAAKRPEMARLLHDVESGLIDLVLFCKLDRWYRNVTEYFKTQEILDAHGVTWNAILEDYETETANGRMTVTIMLSVAQNERERTSERIKAVNDYRRAKGEFLVGYKSVPLGYRLENKHLVKDPDTAPIIEKMFSMVLSGMSRGQAFSRLYAEFPNLKHSYSSLARALYRPIYAGIHDGKENYCPAYITKDQHAQVLAMAGTRMTKTGNTYLFTGLIICPVCGYKMTARQDSYKGVPKVYYKCQKSNYGQFCSNNHILRETRIESVLTGALFKDGEIVVKEIKPAEKAQKAALTADQIESRMKRLAETYTDGLIDREEYKSKLQKLKDELQTIRNAPKTRFKPSPELARQIINQDIKSVYAALNRQEKRRFWMKVLKSVSITPDMQIVNIEFF